jgi:hypothetical protein
VLVLTTKVTEVLAKRLHGTVTTILSAAYLAGAATALAQETAPTTDPERAYERCQAIKDDAARLYCYKNAETSVGGQLPGMIGTWHLVRTPNPTGGRPAVSVMQSADLSRSDVDFTGLMLRCGESTTEVLIVLARYLKPGEQTKIGIQAGPSNMEFSGRVVSPGLLVLLPPQATTLAEETWQKLPELAVSVDDGATIHGVVPLTGLNGALQILQVNCRAQ